MHFTEAMERIAQGFEVIGAALLVFGLVFAGWLALRAWNRTRDGAVAYQTLRRSIGGVLLLGLEVLVAADLLHTVAVEPTLTNVAILGLIVVIRTILSFSLEIEIEGVPPWRRALLPRNPATYLRGSDSSPGTEGESTGTAVGSRAENRNDQQPNPR